MSGLIAVPKQRYVDDEQESIEEGRIHRKKPKGKSTPEATCRANGSKSKAQSRGARVLATQKDWMTLFIRTIAAARATAKIGTADRIDNIERRRFPR